MSLHLSEISLKLWNLMGIDHAGAASSLRRCNSEKFVIIECCLFPKARQQFPESRVDDVISAHRLWRHFKVFQFAQFPSHFMSMWWTLHSKRTMINFSMITSTVNGCDKLHFNWKFVAISIQSRARKKPLINLIKNSFYCCKLTY